MLEEHVFTTRLGDHEIEIATGKLAGQAGGAVTVRSGDTVLLATATMSRSPREGIDFFPLTVDFEERLYAAGRIPGSFFRREGRPSEKAILTSRLIDRSLRPLFPKDMRNEVQIIIVALSQGEEQHSDILGILGASAALTISDVTFQGPIAAVRIGHIDGELVVNPTISEMEESRLDLVISGTEDAIIMVEAGAQVVGESLMLDAMELAHQAIQEAIQTQKTMQEEVGKDKREYPAFVAPEGLEKRVSDLTSDRLRDIIANTELKEERMEALNVAEAELYEIIAAEAEEREWSPREIEKAFQATLKSVVRERVLKEGIRPDGRGPDEIRELSAEVDLVPRPHGSGLFTRGQTQVLSLATLGMPSEEQQLDDLFPEETKHYIHHYNFPPYSTGETWFLRGPKRREIGHGALAERALEPVLPSEEDFPYTIRVVSEVLSSNGSTSMASACASTLALMAAGVPIKAAVGGIAMGLISDGERYRVLTDIQGLEDHLGDMDFKVTGTREGITALQMDIKIKGVTREVLSEALEQARDARMKIIDVILEAIPEPRTELAASAPRMLTTQIDPEKIGKLIGPGGKNIRAIQADYNVKVDVEEDGTVYVASEGPGGQAEEALAYIDTMMEEPEEGKIYTGKVVRTTDFGAFVEILPGTDGMVHISQLADRRVDSVQDVVDVGDEILVMVTNIGSDGKIRLSRQAVLEGWSLEEAKEQDRPKRSSSRGGRPRRR